MPPRVSVLMPVRNAETYLPATLASLLGQTFRDFELLVNDDASDDATANILSDFARRDPRVTVLRSASPQGISATVNALFARAQGAYVTRQDADDLAAPELLARQVAFLDAHPSVGLVAAGVQLIDDQGQPLADQARFNAGQTNAELQRNLLVHNCLATGSVMLRRELLARTGFYDESLEQAEDWDLWLRVAELTELARLPETLHFYRKHSASITRRRRHQLIYDRARVFDRAIFRRSPAPPLDQRAAAARAYFDAALAKAAAGDLPAVEASLDRVLSLEPALLAAQPDNLEAFLLAYTSAAPAERAAAFISGLFARLPAERALQRLKSDWLSRVYMRAVFANAARNDQRQVRANLWSGVRHDPRWLLNRGVLVIAARSLLGARALR